MRDAYPTEGLMESFCRQLGYQMSPNGNGSTVASHPGSRSLVSHVASLVPESVRTAVSRRLPTAIQERRLTEMFRVSTDWTRTLAFSIPSLYTGHIRLNVRGREPQGVVEPGAEYRELVDRLEADLRAIEDPVTGAPAIQAVHRTADLFGETPPELLPDLFVEWEPSTHFRSQVAHPRAVLRQEPPAYFRDSFHTLEGFLIAAGPDIGARGVVSPVDVLDIAPTSLSLLHGRADPAMTGSVARSLLNRSAD
jgi:predicted AlkP superfamily phosphohydrolase/phosphomutase